MAQHAILVYAQDSARAPDAAPRDTEPRDEHSDDLAADDAERAFLEEQFRGGALLNGTQGVSA